MDNTSNIFTFLGHSLDLNSGIASFFYQINHNNQSFKFTEELRFAPEKINKQKINKNLLSKAMDNVMLMLGISYYKLFCSTTIATSVKLSQEQADFWNTIYKKGLGEFFYKNNIDFRDLIHFPFSQNTETEPKTISIKKSDKLLLFFSGGKDSLVSGELLQKAKKQFTTLTINPTNIQTATLQFLNKPNLFITRKLDKQILELNKEKIGYNGHVPFNAITAFIGLFAAIIYDFTYIITSNEQSANYGNIEYLNTEINHQWSKSFAFEKLFQNYVYMFLTPDINYFSLLRPFYEIKIVEMFTKFPQYFSSFSSCNRNFTIENKLMEKNWCGECSKCLFTYIMFSSFLPRIEILKIFGDDYLNKYSFLKIFQELLGIEIKPFECVGTPNEIKLALLKIAKKKEFNNSILMVYFIDEILPNLNEKILETNLSNEKNDNAIPSEFKNVILKI